jgi:bile acid-coenzyme A ligase
MPVLPLAQIPAFYANQLGAGATATMHDDEIISWGELARDSTRIALSMKQRGVAAGDFVTLALPNSGMFFKLTFAVWKLGATPHIVSSRLPKDELAAILGVLHPSLLITNSQELNQTFKGVEPDSLLNCRDGNLPDAVATYWKAMSSGGSTGRPKIIVDHNPAVIEIDGSAMPIMRMPMRGVVLNPGPLHHNAPFLFMHLALFQGNCIVGMKRFDAEEALRLIDKHKVEWVNFVPTMMSRIWRLPDHVRAQYDLSSLQSVWHMAAPMPPWLKQVWIDWLGAARVWELYGGTERNGRTILSGVEWLAHRGSVGRPTSDYIFRVRDAAGRDLPAGEIGEIYMAMANGQHTYHHIGAESRPCADGLEAIGDFGSFDDDGYLYLADRRTDLILSGGANIYPAEVEGALMEHPGVEVAVVIGLPHEDLGAAVHAIVKVRREWPEALNAETLAKFIREKLVLYKNPRSYEFTRQDLRDDAGKVRRSLLREERIAASGRGRQFDRVHLAAEASRSPST